LTLPTALNPPCYFSTFELSVLDFVLRIPLPIAKFPVLKGPFLPRQTTRQIEPCNP
jgi:hypothetical protein